MKTRTKFQITVIAMLIETVLLAAKQPLLYNIQSIAHFDQGLATTIVIYYTYLYKMAKVICYLFFLIFVLLLEKEYKHKIFGKFFIADFAVYVLDASILYLLMFAPDLSNNVRHYTEIVIALMSAFTSFFAGTFLYQKIRSKAFRKIRTAYRLYALRYILYVVVLSIELILHNFKGMGYMELGSYTWWVVLSWAIRMPLLIYSRVVLFTGVMDMKTAKETHEEHKENMKHLHHHHHKHHHSKDEAEEQTMDS
ncbi:MAG: hypothetical protein J6Y15_05960 [Bacteroidaceae bacterium]|nr:hypothetical protein [Bacteroidaceae bacterium]